jgi:hypothetical protein
MPYLSSAQMGMKMRKRQIFSLVVGFFDTQLGSIKLAFFSINENNIPVFGLSWNYVHYHATLLRV